jgi:hypothetical protein
VDRVSRTRLCWVQEKERLDVDAAQRAVDTRGESVRGLTANLAALQLASRTSQEEADMERRRQKAAELSFIRSAERSLLAEAEAKLSRERTEATAADEHAEAESQEAEAASAPFPSWIRSILTEVHLCHACSDHEILRMDTVHQAHAAAEREEAEALTAKAEAQQLEQEFEQAAQLRRQEAEESSSAQQLQRGMPTQPPPPHNNLPTPVTESRPEPTAMRRDPRTLVHLEPEPEPEAEPEPQAAPESAREPEVKVDEARQAVAAAAGSAAEAIAVPSTDERAFAELVITGPEPGVYLMRKRTVMLGRRMRRQLPDVDVQISVSRARSPECAWLATPIRNHARGAEARLLDQPAYLSSPRAALSVCGCGHTHSRSCTRCGGAPSGCVRVWVKITGSIMMRTA